MKKLIAIAVLLISLTGYGQYVTTPAIVADTTALKAYNGPSGVILVTNATYQGWYFKCPSCTVNYSTVFAGTGGKKWSKANPSGGSGGSDTTSLSGRINDVILATAKNITLANLRSFTPSAGQLFYVTDAGKQGPWYYDASDAVSADDTATIAVSGSYRFKRIYFDKIYPEWWGAVGDGTTDDGAAFNRMYRWMERAANRSFEVAHRSRKYLINTQVNLPHSLTSAGEFRRIKINGNGVEYTTSTAIKVLSRQPASQSDALNTMIGAYALTIDGLKISGDGDAGQVGMDLSALYTPVIQNCYFVSLDTGVVAKFWLNAVIQNNFFTNNISVAFKGASGEGYWSSATTSNSAFNIAHIRGNRVVNYGGAHSGFMFWATDGVIMDGHISEGGNPRYDIYVNSQLATVVNGNSFSNIWFESSGGPITINTCFYLRMRGNIVINTIQNDYADTLLTIDPASTNGKIIAENWTYFNVSADKLFDGGGALNSTVAMEVRDMPINFIEYFFNATKWTGNVIGVHMAGLNLESLETILRTSKPLRFNAGSQQSHFTTAAVNLYSGGNLRLYNATDLTNYNRMEFLMGATVGAFNIGRAGTASNPTWLWQLQGVNKIEIDNNYLVNYVSFLPGTDNTYDLGRTSGPLRFRTGYFGTSVVSAKYFVSALNTAPSSATDTGTLGEIRITSGFIYVCIASNSWVRTALSVW